MARVIVAISGASGAAVAVDVLHLLKERAVEVHLIVSHWGAITLEHETGMRTRDLQPLVHTIHSNKNMASALASGSYPVDAMAIVPCSARTLGAIAQGTDPSLLGRAADVCLKERRKLVCALRETPLSAIHLANALAVTNAGGIVAPLVPTFYANPHSVSDIVHDMASRIVESLGFRVESSPHWGENTGLEIHRSDAPALSESSSDNIHALNN
ncbi:MAG: UbiX family flavin prenyltransferase [Ancrocorticia sp.]|jgi:4-hydroxy-3-polyprenylbenzoate decarboxylase|nr:UbiX family flavin prenyltransferase [Ancrocorticia sp.]MCI1896268.1 UbiX family flavin prenyltransferase [Ancrocorticia sp.]MCI1933013.1 UbiX family flavin prenyltransferase [Ancrocorticia sp.]MCI1962663.1 UbiX family flavin prenyltransferase [Ancrocorticia sp.]MCI2002056.1 UbiX family flavin prenyltransferase [Ancrocorticia sp.]